ncbi:MAG TPA: putative nucleotide-diphospho-sugar transferase [Xenococcaceae cyanobacterium]
MIEGYLYVAVGEKFLKEAICSAQSLRKIDSNAHITLVTDQTIENNLVFDNILIKPTTINNHKEGLLYKVEHIYFSSPYDKTLFLDTDTYVCESCINLFKLLDFFDLAIAPDPTDVNRAMIPNSQKKLEASDLYNTGVIIFQKNQRTETLFKNWLDIYQTKITQKTVNKENDQTSFVESLLQSEAKIYVLSHA